MNQSPSVNPYTKPYIVAKPNIQHLPLPILKFEHGIPWQMVSEVFTRFGWEIMAETDLFIIASHPKTGQTIQVSKMAQGYALVNQDYMMLAVSDLHVLEAIAEEPLQVIHTSKMGLLDKVRNWMLLSLKMLASSS